MPLQTEPVVLPSATLTIPAPNSRSHNTPTTSSSNLKIRFTPHLLVPTPPFAQGVSGRKIEDCVEIVVDIGGRVDLGLEIDEDALEWAGEYGGEDVEGLIKKRVRGLFEANVSYLALSGTREHNSNTDFPPSPLDEYSSSPSTNRNTLTRIVPLISDPSYSPLLKTLTTTGRPQAILTRLEIKLEWAPVISKRILSESQAEEEEMEEEEEGADSQESGEGEASQHVWDQDEFCDVPAEDEDMGADGEVGKEQGLPKWVEGQLKNGIHKLMRTHMIRRFPLLFDSGLIQHASTLALHRSLTASLTHFLTLSSTHSTSFLNPARHLLQSLSTNQEAFINLTVDAASSIRGTGTKNPIKRAKRRKTDTGDEDVEPDLQTAKGRSRAYMLEVAKNLEEEGAGSRADERRVGRLVGEAMGRVGRGTWDQGRKGIGKMAAFRVPLSDVNNFHPAEVNPAQFDRPPISISVIDDDNPEIFIEQDDMFLNKYSNENNDDIDESYDGLMLLDFDVPASVSNSDDNFGGDIYQDFDRFDHSGDDVYRSTVDTRSRDGSEEEEAEGLYDREDWMMPGDSATDDLFNDSG